MFYLILLFILCVAFQPTVRSKVKKFNNLAKQYRDHNKIGLIPSYGKAFYLVSKCTVIDLYQSYTSFYTRKFTFIKYIHGGNLYVSIISNKTGPKPTLEYGYIDEIRQDEIILMLSGINRDFSGVPDSLLEFGNTIRYKYSDQEEIKIISKNQSGSENEKKLENIKKFKKLVWSS
jgi:hypothetical protein